MTISGTVAALDRDRTSGNLSSTIRLFVLDYLIRASDEDRQKLGAGIVVLQKARMDVAA